MTIWITTNGRPSNGAKALASQPGFKRCIKGGGIKQDDVLINWGSSKFLPDPIPSEPIFLNHPNIVCIASNKLSAFKVMIYSPIKTVEWTDNPVTADTWQLQGFTVVVRNKLTGHSGDGIIIVEKGEPIPNAPLYTKYIFKEKEFRVHVVGANVIDTQRKIKDPSREVISWKVRSHQNGFIYARNGINHDPGRDELAVAAVDALGLHFGAVDIIQDKEGAYYVLEINTAPGLEGQTVGLYAQAFRDWKEQTDE